MTVVLQVRLQLLSVRSSAWPLSLAPPPLPMSPPWHLFSPVAAWRLVDAACTVRRIRRGRTGRTAACRRRRSWNGGSARMHGAGRAAAGSSCRSPTTHRYRSGQRQSRRRLQMTRAWSVWNDSRADQGEQCSAMQTNDSTVRRSRLERRMRAFTVCFVCPCVRAGVVALECECTCPSVIDVSSETASVLCCRLMVRGRRRKRASQSHESSAGSIQGNSPSA